MRILFIILFSTACNMLSGQALHSKFKQNQTLTYAELMDAYKKLDTLSELAKLETYCCADNGLPIHVLVINKDKNFNPPAEGDTNRLVLLVMNGIHPGESEGIDASLLLAQQLLYGQIPIPEHVTICVIPVYNVEGMLNRRAFVRTNQNGPEEKGFRGNGKNLDLNRDFIKADAKNTLAFYDIFHHWQPDVFLDNHTSNGADYQYTMTLIATQQQKLGGKSAALLYNQFLPWLNADMAKRKWEMAPYVNVFGKTPDEDGYEAFLETPRYSTGYAALFGTIGFVAETHMLKPYPDRVMATHALMQSLITYMNNNASAIKQHRLADREWYKQAVSYESNFKLDKSVQTNLTFKGFEAEKKPSTLGNYQRLFYNRQKPFTKTIPYYQLYKPSLQLSLPKAYLIPQSWERVIKLLERNNVKMERLLADTTMEVYAWYISSYESSARPYEGHHYNAQTKAEKRKVKVQFLQGDYVIRPQQTGSRFIAEVLEPLCEDSYFAWNFFDPILNAKEGFSDYAFEDDAVTLLANNPELKAKFEAWKTANPEKATQSYEVLGFIFKHSHLYEVEHNRVPVFRVE